MKRSPGTVEARLLLGFWRRSLVSGYFKGEGDGERERSRMPFVVGGRVLMVVNDGGRRV